MPFLGNTTTSFNVDGNNINNGAITSEKIATGAVVNADVNDTASIAGTKISADFGAQNLVVDTNVLFVNATNDRVGIGTSSPLARFHLDNGSSDNFSYFQARGANELESSLIFLTKNSAGTSVGGSIGHDGATNTLYLTGATTGGATQHLSIDANGKIGVGTTSPGSFYANADNLVVGTGSGHNGITIYAGTTSEASICFADGTSSSAPYIGRILYEHNTNSLSFDTGAQQRMIIDSSGRVGIGTSSPTTITTGNTNLTLGPGSSGSEGSEIHMESATHNGSGNGANISYIGSDLYVVNRESGFLGLYTNATERVRIDSSGNVGIGTTSPADKLHVEGGGLRLEEDGGVTISYREATTGSAELIFRDAKAGSDRLKIDSSGNVGIGTTSPSVVVEAQAAQAELQLKSTSGSNSAGLRFVPGGETNALYIYADGSRNINFDNHATSLISVRSGGGITFNGDTSTDNALDDYEQGTWTPVLQDNSGNEATMTVQQGFYTKIGDIVNVWFQIAWSSKGSMGGIIYFTGFPFSAKSNSSNYYYIGATIRNGSTNGVVALAGGGTTAVSQPFDGPSSNQPPSYLSSSGRILCSLTYFT